MLTKIEFTYTSLEIMNDLQKDALCIMADGDNIEKIEVGIGPSLSLPANWLSFRSDYKSGTSIYGGIDPEGNVST